MLPDQYLCHFFILFKHNSMYFFPNAFFSLHFKINSLANGFFFSFHNTFPHSPEKNINLIVKIVVYSWALHGFSPFNVHYFFFSPLRLKFISALNFICSRGREDFQVYFFTCSTPHPVRIFLSKFIFAVNLICHRKTNERGWGGVLNELPG